MSYALILANGAPPGQALLERALASAGLFVCADGGANAAWAMGEVPAAVVGDLDSITPEARAHFERAGVRFVYDADTEHTDLDKAIGWVLAQGKFDEVRIFGATSGRLDHVIGHIGLLYRHRGATRLVLEGDAVQAFLGQGEVRLELPVGTQVSFFAVGPPAHGVSTENLRYPLASPDLRIGGQDSISNEVLASPAWVRITRGDLLVFVVRQP